LRRLDFLDFLLRQPTARQSVTSALSTDFGRTCKRLCAIDQAFPAKLALLVLEWPAGSRQTERSTWIRISLTHGEIGEYIGVSPETVARILNKFRCRQMVPTACPPTMRPISNSRRGNG
jgi:CRP-like cAMP-binding protein